MTKLNEQTPFKQSYKKKTPKQACRIRLITNHHIILVTLCYAATVPSSSRRKPSARVRCRMSGCLQVGQEECDRNQVSMHFTWKPWLHLGKTLTFSPSTNSPKQIKHSVAFVLSSELYESTGIRFKSRFLIPFATFAFGLEWVGSSLGVDLLVQRKTHRKTELRPRAQIKAHRRAARIITMFVSKVSISLVLLLEPPKVLGFASVAEIVELACVSSKNLPIFQKRMQKLTFKILLIASGCVQIGQQRGSRGETRVASCRRVASLHVGWPLIPNWKSKTNKFHSW